MPERRDFLSGLLAAGALPALAPPLRSFLENEDQTGAPAPQDPAAYAFWAHFLESVAPPLTTIPNRTRDIASPVDREPFFFHNGEQGLQPAVDIRSSDLIEDGDVTVSLNVAAFRPSEADVKTFQNLKSAQLRLDFVQNLSIVDLIDTMAWTGIAILMADKRNKLPPIQHLSFDPSTSWQRMQNIPLPGGQGRWALNLIAQKADGAISQILKFLNKEVGRFAPVFGFPGITLPALQSFNEFYGAFHSKPEYLLRSNPVPVVATRAAQKQLGASNALPLHTGTYVLMPVTHAMEFASAPLKGMQVTQGYVVPQGTTSVAAHDVGQGFLKNVTYATLDVVVKPVQLPCAGKTRPSS